MQQGKGKEKVRILPVFTGTTIANQPKDAASPHLPLQKLDLLFFFTAGIAIQRELDKAQPLLTEGL
jgi:hypothetical protein